MLYTLSLHDALPICPLYEEVLDTQMFGLSREIDFAVRLELITEDEGRALLDNLEHKLSVLYEKAENSTRKDRKSTRLNSSHVAISYAVFCLKKKKK